MSADNLAGLHAEHLRTLQARCEEALAATGHAALVLHAGTPLGYWADDQEAPFHPNPPFAWWTPLAGPFHLLLARPGERPRLVRVAPEDYWYEQAPLGEPFWASGFESLEVADEAAAWKALGAPAGAAYVGDAPERAREHLGLPAAACNPRALVDHLAWWRAVKTPYEVACLEEAGRAAARGHAAARAAFLEGAPELAIHHAYVRAAGCVDHELPYESIIALDEKSAILHYLGKRREGRGRVLLNDSGATCLGYAADITRTWTAPDCDPLFVDLVAGVDAYQQRLCALARPGVPWLDVHLAAHREAARLLHELGVLRCDPDGAIPEISTAFFPHGLGHLLGLQVHDVGGWLAGPEGGQAPPPPEHPFLRLTRRLEADMVVTVEPGIYCIPMLLRPLREGPRSGDVDWDLVDRLTPLGGVRIEDDVLVTPDGPRNLTRAAVDAACAAPVA